MIIIIITPGAQDKHHHHNHHHPWERPKGRFVLIRWTASPYVHIQLHLLLVLISFVYDRPGRALG